VQLPANYSRNATSIPPIRPRKAKDGTVFEVKAGTYEFHSQPGI
jgi:hypothetical protein